jgi:hypothetical protein
MGSPDAAKRNPGYFSPLSVLSRISLRFIRATPFPKTPVQRPANHGQAHELVFTDEY